MNWGILGHEWAVQLLKGHIANDNLRHAYLFAGPQGVGRRTLALRFAQAINCQSADSPDRPCRRCKTCEHIWHSKHPDLAIVQSEQPGNTLQVDQIRELQRSLSFAPYEARYRIAILLRFEEASLSAGNALLKTLEEPNQKVILLVTTQSAEELLPTVVSRCELLRLRPISVEKVREGLQEKWGLDSEKASILAHISNGRPGYAVHLNNHLDVLEQRQVFLDDFQRLLKFPRVHRFTYAEKLSKDKTLLRSAIQMWSSLCRDVLLRALNTSTRPANIDREAEIDLLATQISVGRISQILKNLENTLQRLEKNVNPRLAAEILLLDLPFLK